MLDFKLIADSTCDLSQDIVTKYDIDIVPLSVNIGNDTYFDGVEITADQFYGMIEGLEKPATTAAPAPEAFLNAFERAVEAGYKKILCITMSSGTSACYQSAKVAEKAYQDKYPQGDITLYIVDSISMSHGSGWLIMKSAMLRERGMSFEDIIQFNESFKRQMKHFLSVDDLDHLIRSGRLTNASAFIGKLLKIKPIMSMRDTKGVIVAKERGRKGVLRHYIKAFNQRIDLEMSNFIIIGYTSDIAYAENLKTQIERETVFTGDIYLMQMGVSVGVHVGLGGLSLYFIEKEHLKDGLFSNELIKLNEAKEEVKKRMQELTERMLP